MAKVKNSSSETQVLLLVLLLVRGAHCTGRICSRENTGDGVLDSPRSRVNGARHRHAAALSSTNTKDKARGAWDPDVPVQCSAAIDVSGWGLEYRGADDDDGDFSI